MLPARNIMRGVTSAQAYDAHSRYDVHGRGCGISNFDLNQGGRFDVDENSPAGFSLLRRRRIDP